MRQIIIDFGLVDLTDVAVYLRIVGFILLAVGGLGLGWFRSAIARASGKGGSLISPGIAAVVAGIVLVGLDGPGLLGKIGPYVMAFGPGYLAGVLVFSFWSPKSDSAESVDQKQLKRFEYGLNIAVILLIPGAGAMALELLGYSVSPRVYGYGLMLVCGFALSTLLAQWLARRAGENPTQITQIAILSLVGGIVGSRAAYVIKYPENFVNGSLLEIVNISSGGLVYYGGLVLAATLVLVYMRIRRLPMRRFLDILSASIMLGLAFGRAGCLLNGCCYGSLARPDWPLSTSFAMYSKPLVKLDGRQNPYSLMTDSPSPVYADQLERGSIFPDASLILSGPGQANLIGSLIAPRDFTADQIALAEKTFSHPVKPAQVLGIINGVLLAGLLLVFYRIRRREGQVFALFLICYPITRFILELVRATDPHDISKGIFTHNQYTSVAMLAMGVVMMLSLRFVPASSGATWQQRHAGQGGDGN